ncbi:DUF7490 domain-containing protein [Halorubrum sp. DTA98]|uniref:DUF7490 domain-containing protein n=1 Tax=Halorubrum sp. DTA98 TaxID=3402163 RepID=UPI003AAACF8C
MDTRTALLSAAVVLFLVGAIGVVAVPGALDDPRERDGPDYPSHLSVADVVVQPGDVGGATAELDVLMDLEHRGSTAENVTVRFRAIDADSGLLADETTVEVGDVETDAGDADGAVADDPAARRAAMESSSERRVEGTLEVERSGGYRLETLVYVDGERRTEQSTRVSGVAALTPSYADSRVGFTDGTVWPTVTVTVRNTDADTTTLDVSASVTNRGDTDSADLDLRLLVRQAESNVVADDAEVTVGSIRPGRTDTVTATVEVPNEYNYYVDVALWDDDVLIDETQSVANLDPQESIQANETVQNVEFAVDDFTDDAETVTDRPTPEAEDAGGTEEDTPGFGIALAVVAIAAAALFARRNP